VVKAFTNRLMHLGFRCFVVGDVTTPPIHKDDILFILSGSGKTSSLVEMAKKAKEYGASILTITLQKEGNIAKIAKACIVLPGTTRLQNKVLFESIQPIGSSFEQLSWLTCDALILLLKQKLGLKNEDLIKNHANLE
ncbi:6-phospho-3-hexuloisomerase, partial [Floccifex sp.]|uniref:6-phospho-3-hexuloisomerase n=1 Tax=Floccifex sp. TaxID=2815810 RepID=UPI003F078F13